MLWQAHIGWGSRRAAGAILGARAEGVRADGKILFNRRHSGGGTGWFLDSSRTAKRGNRELRGRSGLDYASVKAGGGERGTDRIDGEALTALLLATNGANCASALSPARRRPKTPA